MFTFLKQVDNVVQQTLKLAVRKLQPLKVGQKLADLELTKDGHSTIVKELKPFQLHTWAEYGQDPAVVASRLFATMDKALTNFDHSKLVLYVSPVYMDYEKGQFYARGVTIMLQCVVYQYDGQTLTTLERETDYHVFEEVKTEHKLTEYSATKVCVWTPNIERDFNANLTSKVALSTEGFQQQVLSDFDVAVASARQLVQRTIHVLYCQKRITEKLGEGNYESAAVLFQELLGSEVKYHETSGVNHRFIFEGVAHMPESLLDQARAQVSLPPIETNDEEDDE